MKDSAAAPLSRRLLWPFAVVVLVLVAELAWWVTFQVQQSGERAALALSQAERERHLAAEALTLRAAQMGQDTERAGAYVREHFPALTWQSASSAHVGLQSYYPGFDVVLRPAFVAEVEAKRRRVVRMFVAEGIVFAFLVAIGIALVLRALRREVGLVRQQSNFVSAVTHELKSPLAAIRLYAETLALRQPDAERQAHYLEKIADNVGRLEGLVSNLLDAARLEERRPQQRRPEVVDLAVATRDFVASFRPEALARGAELRVEVLATSLPVRIDATVVEPLLRNLLDNAIKYGPTTGEPEVVVRLDQAGGAAVVSVRDNGLGLQEDECNRVFDKFYRSGDELRRQASGSGLGLYLVRAWVEQHGGDVLAQSDGPGQGATFSVRLPLVSERTLEVGA